MCFVLITETLSGIKWRESMLNEKAAVSCEILKRVVVMKVTFVALKVSASSVACMVTSVPRRVGALRVKASRPVEKGTGVCGARLLVEMTGGVMAEASASLQKMSLAARGGVSGGFRASMGRDSEFEHIVSQWCCKSAAWQSRWTIGKPLKVAQHFGSCPLCELLSSSCKIADTYSANINDRSFPCTVVANTKRRSEFQLINDGEDELNRRSCVAVAVAACYVRNTFCCTHLTRQAGWHWFVSSCACKAPVGAVTPVVS
ncbi:hypothetical protein TRVL_07719 [Trypanosoma vivax]|nr:hypothetical protein TRVL_07719 [Trypanosoma vivax]